MKKKTTPTQKQQKTHTKHNDICSGNAVGSQPSQRPARREASPAAHSAPCAVQPPVRRGPRGARPAAASGPPGSVIVGPSGGAPLPGTPLGPPRSPTTRLSVSPHLLLLPPRIIDRLSPVGVSRARVVVVAAADCSDCFRIALPQQRPLKPQPSVCVKTWTYCPPFVLLGSVRAPHPPFLSRAIGVSIVGPPSHGFFFSTPA